MMDVLNGTFATLVLLVFFAPAFAFIWYVWTWRNEPQVSGRAADTFRNGFMVGVVFTVGGGYWIAGSYAEGWPVLVFNGSMVLYLVAFVWRTAGGRAQRTARTSRVDLPAGK